MMLRFTFTPDDVRAAAGLMMRRFIRSPLYLLWVAGLALLLIGMMLLTLVSSWGWIGAVVVAAVLLFFSVRIEQAKQEELQRGEVTMELGETIQSTGGGVSSRYPWRLFDKLVEGKTVILITGPTLAIVIPKRALGDSTDIERLRSLVRTRLSAPAMAPPQRQGA